MRWTAIIVVLFVVAMFAFPNRKTVLAGLPTDYVITFGVGLLLLVVLGYFGWQHIQNDPEGGQE